jgi:hypothetical protein
MRSKLYVNYRDNMDVLRLLCSDYSEILGKTVFATHVSDGFARIQVQRPGTKIRDPFVDGRIAQLCAIIKWEILKAEGQLRLAV